MVIIDLCLLAKECVSSELKAHLPPLGQFKLVDALALAPRSRHLKHEVKVRLILDRRMNLGKDNSLWRHLCLIGERAWQAGAGIYGSIRPAWCSASLHLLLPTLKYSVFMKHPSAHVPELIILWDGMELILRISLDFKQLSECTTLEYASRLAFRYVIPVQ